MTKRLHREYLTMLAAGHKSTAIAAKFNANANVIRTSLSYHGLPTTPEQMKAWLDAGNSIENVGRAPNIPVPKKAQVVLTLEAIFKRCEEFGDCLLWTGAMTNGRHLGGSPSARHNGKTVSVRRLAWVLANPKRQAIPGMRIMTTCHEARCVNPKHLQQVTRAEMQQRLSALGVYNSPAIDARRIAGSRNAACRKMTMEKARAVRQSDAPAHVEAARYNVSAQLITAIRRGELWAEVSSRIPANSVFALGMAA